MKIDLLKKKGLGPEGTTLELTTKDFLMLTFIFPREQEFAALFDSLNALTTLGKAFASLLFETAPH